MTQVLETVDSNLRRETLTSLLQHVQEKYLDPEIAAEACKVLAAQMEEGVFDACDTVESFVSVVTKKLQEAGRDSHFEVLYTPVTEQLMVPENWEAHYRKEIVLVNCGLEKAERLPGNIGYLDIRQFAEPAVTGETLAAAMTFLANTSALIVDLRENVGGYPETVALLCSYLFEERKHVMSFYDREEEFTYQDWTSSAVAGKKYGEAKPVYVLTSRRTFSAGEALADILQAHKRAKVIGEVTGGGANPGRYVRLNEWFRVLIPSGRPVNPVTGGNWDGKGVSPDVAASKVEACGIAYKEALQHVLDTTDPEFRDLLKEAQKALASL